LWCDKYEWKIFAHWKKDFFLIQPVTKVFTSKIKSKEKKRRKKNHASPPALAELKVKEKIDSR
jgi:hypothetical protein